MPPRLVLQVHLNARLDHPELHYAVTNLLVVGVPAESLQQSVETLNRTDKPIPQSTIFQVPHTPRSYTLAIYLKGVIPIAS